MSQKTAMNTVDVIVILVIAVNGLIGALRGFVWQSIRLGSIALGIFLARTCGPGLARWSQSWLSWDPTGRRVLAYVVVFLGTYVVGSLLAHLFRELLSKAHLSSADRGLGFLLGCAKGLLLVWVAFYFLFLFYPLLPSDVRVQLKGAPSEKIAPSRSFQLWNRWVRDQLDKVMPPEIQGDMQDARKAFGR